MSGDWRDRAACRGADLTVEAELAKGLPQFGWFGGKSAEDREAIVRKRKRTPKAAA